MEHVAADLPYVILGVFEGVVFGIKVFVELRMDLFQMPQIHRQCYVQIVNTLSQHLHVHQTLAEPILAVELEEVVSRLSPVEVSRDLVEVLRNPVFDSPNVIAIIQDNVNLVITAAQRIDCFGAVVHLSHLFLYLVRIDILTTIL